MGEPDVEISPIHIGLWLAFGLCLLLTGVGFAIERAAFGWSSMIAAAVLGLAILSQKLGFWQPSGIQLAGGRRLGRAPYQKAEALSAAEFLAQIAASIQQVREGADKQGWDVDWGPIEKSCATAEGAVDQKKPSQALTAYSEAMSRFVGECRRVLKAASDAGSES